MPGLNGVEATRRIVAATPSIAVLVLTMLDEDESVFAAMRAGARGYVVKGADTDDLLRALESVARGDVVFGPAVASRVLSYLTRPLSARDPVLFPELSDREREVLELLARGMPNSQIARTLVVSPKTVRNHVSNIFTKLQVNDRAEAISAPRPPDSAANPHARSPGTPGTSASRMAVMSAGPGRPGDRPPVRLRRADPISPEDKALPYRPGRLCLCPGGRGMAGRSFGIGSGCRVNIRCLASVERNPLASILTCRAAMRILMAASKPGGLQLAIARGRSIVGQAPSPAG